MTLQASIPHNSLDNAQQYMAEHFLATQRLTKAFQTPNQAGILSVQPSTSKYMVKQLILADLIADPGKLAQLGLSDILIQLIVGSSSVVLAQPEALLVLSYAEVQRQHWSTISLALYSRFQRFNFQIPSSRLCQQHGGLYFAQLAKMLLLQCFL